MQYEAHVISLDPEGARFATFRSSNAHLDFQIFQAVRGADLSREEILANHLVAPKCLDAGLVPAGQIGAMASHLRLWQEAASRRMPLLIMEDDVFTHQALHGVIAGLKPDLDFDMILFGVNTDSLLVTLSPEGVREISHFQDRYPSPARIAAILAATDPRRLSLRRLFNCFGLCCYLITPQGADKLIPRILPLQSETVPLIGLPGATISGISNDRRLNMLFHEIKAFVCRPFLAWTPNSDSSTRAPVPPH